MVNFKFGKNKKTNSEPIVEEKKEEKKLENDDYVKRIDSLQNQVQLSNQKINELAKKIEQQQQQQTNSNQQVTNNQQQNTNNAQQKTSNQNANNDNQNQNTAAVQNNSSKALDSGVWFVSNEAKDFTDEKNKNPEPAFYVVVGTFYYKDLAQAEAKRIADRGFQTKIIYFEPKKFNYIYLGKFSNKESAIQKAKELQSAGFKDSWVQLIVD